MGKSTWYRLIVADNSDDNKRMAVLFAKNIEGKLIEMDCSGMREDVIIDLNFGGRRWEGEELNGKPFGFGCEYSEDGNLVYEGFVFEGMKVCVGKEWNDDGNNNCLVYEGGYCNGERWGKGISFDLTGNVTYYGEWMNNQILIKKSQDDLKNSFYGSNISFDGEWTNDQSNNLNLPMSIDELGFCKKDENEDNIQNNQILDISPMFIRLERIVIGEGSFPNVYGLNISGFVNLKRIRIGDSCFVSEVGNSSTSKVPKMEFNISNCPRLRLVAIGKKCFRIKHEEEERDDGLFYITNCPNLQKLRIGDDSFSGFKSFHLSSVNSLKFIKFGKSCFKLASIMHLRSK